MRKIKVIHYSWDCKEEGSVIFLSNSWVKFTYLGDVSILPLTLPLSDSEGRTSQHPDNWKYSTIGRWLVTAGCYYDLQTIRRWLVSGEEV